MTITPHEHRIINRKLLADNFPLSGSVRAKQISAYLDIGLSTFWKAVKAGRIIQPTKLGYRTSVWDANYIRSLAEHGIPLEPEAQAA